MSGNQKCVLVLDEALPLGLVANTAAILGITLGKRMPEVVGAGVRDGAGREHLGIITFPVPVLRGTAELLGKLRESLYEPEFQDLTAVDFSNLAQRCKTYEAFSEEMEKAEDLRYLGLAICGERKKVDHLTGSLPLLR